MLKRIIFLASILFSTAALAGNPDSNFYPVRSSTLYCNATTTSSYAQFTSASALVADDLLVKNISAVVIAFDLGVGGSGASPASVPTNTVGGSVPLNPGDAIIVNKRNQDTITCITPTGSGTLSVTPGYGQ